jgi:GNAT superfamily N-acetyltransferase
MADDTIQILPLTAQQHAAWLPLWRGYQTFYKAELSSEVSEITWSRLLDAQEPMGGALAWNGAEAVGLVHHIRHRSCWTVGDYMYMQDLFVSAGARGAGVGRKLIDYVCRLAGDQGCSRVYWLTHETNTQAMILYDQVAERSGFVQYRRSLK